MEKILVSDTGEHSARIAYIYNALSSLLPGVSSFRPKIFVGQTRSAIAAEESVLTPELLRSVKELLIETVAIGYKYGYLSARLPLQRLTLEDRKFFLCALIAADLPADKRYIRSRLSEVEACALDGFFSFRLQPLKSKWDKIISYIPPDFSSLEMERFMQYLVDGNRGRIYLKAGEVYDEKYRLCRRSQLVGEEANLEAEILLSGAKEVRIFQPLSKNSVLFLRKYYGEYAVF